MPANYCSHCGQALIAENKFCSECGASVSPSENEAPPVFVGHRLNNRLVAFLCYCFWVVGGILFLNLEPYSRNLEVRFHAWQSIYFHVAWIILALGFGLTAMTLGILGFPFFGVLVGLANLVMFVGWIYLMVAALQGQKKHFPIVGELALRKASLE
jgi:uncharacterized membrane protein